MLSHEKLAQSRAMYNMVPNVIWSVLSLAPIYVFCYRYLPIPCLLVFLFIAVVALFIPRRVLDALQLFDSSAAYRKIGVHFVNRFVQDGVIINRVLKRKYPDAKPNRPSAAQLANLIARTYMFEKFHFGMFVFFALATTYALYLQLLLWAACLSVLNLLYNVYPNLLQQSVRIRLRRLGRKGTER